MAKKIAPSPHTGVTLGPMKPIDLPTHDNPGDVRVPERKIGGAAAAMSHQEGGVPQNMVPAAEADRQDACARAARRGR